MSEKKAFNKKIALAISNLNMFLIIYMSGLKYTMPMLGNTPLWH